MIAADLQTYLEADAGIASAAPGGTYPLYSIPQQENRAVLTYSIDDTFREITADGLSNLARVSVDVIAWANSYGAATQAMQAVHAALNYYAGSWGTTRVARVFPENGGDDLYDDEVKRYGISRPFLIWFYEQ